MQVGWRQGHGARERERSVGDARGGRRGAGGGGLPDQAGDVAGGKTRSLAPPGQTPEKERY